MFKKRRSLAPVMAWERTHRQAEYGVEANASVLSYGERNAMITRDKKNRSGLKTYSAALDAFLGPGRGQDIALLFDWRPQQVRSHAGTHRQAPTRPRGTNVLYKVTNGVYSFLTCPDLLASVNVTLSTLSLSAAQKVRPTGWSGFGLDS